MPLSAAGSRAKKVPRGAYPLHEPGADSPPSYHWTMATSLHLDTLMLVTRLHLLEVCSVAVQLAQQ
jgi:hypothetical protein